MSKWTKRSRGLYDNGDWTISVGSEYFADGDHNPFRVVLIHRVTVPGGGAPKPGGGRHDGRVVKRYSATIPTIKFRTAFRFRKVGLLSIYRWQGNTISRLFTR